MSLKYPGEWKFDGVGFGLPEDAVREFVGLIEKIASGSQNGIEIFKSALGGRHASSDYGWAVSDLYTLAYAAAPNAAAFVDGIWSGIEAARESELLVPSPRTVNAILEKYGIPLRVEPPNLVALSGDAVIVGPQVVGESTGPSPLFVLGDQIGKGGYGVVHRATRVTAIGEFEYAIKLLDPSPFVADHDRALSRFQREVKAVQLLQHRAVVPHYEAGVGLGNKPYIVMPYIKGRDLRSATSSMKVQEVLEAFIEISGGLAYAHSLNVVHRDLKPTNILIRDSDRQPIILDFGSSYLLDTLESENLTSGAVGTLGYMPSEVIADPKIRSPLQDVYACGVMLYECLAGRQPDPRHYVPLTTIDGRYAPIDKVIQEAIAEAPARTPSAAELRAALRAALSGV